MSERDDFGGLSTVRTVGGLIPADLLGRVVAGNDLPGLTADDYHLELGVTPREAANRAWSVLSGAWVGYRDALAGRPDGDRATGLTREKWLGVLLRELGFGRVPTTRAGGIHADGRSFPVSHLAGDVPVHLLGWGVDLDRRTAGVAGAADRAPHAMVQELLNRSDDHLWAVLANGGTLRLLRDSSSLVGQAYVEFDLQAMFDGEAFSDFVALYLLCHQTRFTPVDPESGPEDCWLERWRSDAVETGARALGQLRDGVKRAIESLGTGFLQHPANADLRSRLEPGGGLDLADYHRALLRLVYRLLFCFVAEDRGLLLDPDASDTAKSRYAQWFSTARLRRIATRRRGTRHADLWQALSLVIDGLGSNDGRPELALPGIGGLFEDGLVDVVAGQALANDALLAAIRHLCVIQPKEGGPRRSVDYRDLGSEELGGIYESLLEYEPRRVTPRTFALAPLAGNERRATGAFYTPTSLIEFVLDSALDPLLDEAEGADDPEVALLALSICDPACGSGHFLVAAARRVAHRVARVRSDRADPTAFAAQEAMHDVAERCVYGVDLNPMAAELAKVSLWLEALQPGRPLSFLDAHIKVGNALLGTTPALVASGIPDEAFVVLEGDDKQTAAMLRKKNSAERVGQDDLFGATPIGIDTSVLARASLEVSNAGSLSLADVHLAQLRQRAFEASEALQGARMLADIWCAAFLIPKKPGDHLLTTGVLRRASQRQGKGEEWEAAVTHVAAEHRFLHWHLEFPEVFAIDANSSRVRPGFDCVIGNPPFISPITASGSRVSRSRHLAKAVHGFLGGPKADDSSYFLLTAASLVSSTGRFALVLPDSFLSAADSADIRSRLTQTSDLAMIWRGDGSEFAAAVTTIVVSFAPLHTACELERFEGPSFVRIDGGPPPWRSGSWSILVARDAQGLDSLFDASGPTMASICTVTADYRDQYYGLRGAVYDTRDDEPATRNPPLVTTGLIDPLKCYWGERSTKFDKEKFHRPRVNLEALTPSMQRWAGMRLVPKLMIATQGRMPEVVIDHEGAWLPCVPVITVVSSPEVGPPLQVLAAILVSPAAFEYLRLTKLGAGLSTSAIKISAADIRSMPAPTNLGLVGEAALLLGRLGESDTRHEFRKLMNAAYGLPEASGDVWDRTLASYLETRPALGRSRPSRRSL